MNENKSDSSIRPSRSGSWRTIRVFISSTFCDMKEERNMLMTHSWPELRRFCKERQVELVEVDLRWGISESQSTRNETLKLCLDEIRACRPFFIGLLGERYGGVPGNDAFTADLKEEHPWLKDFHGKSFTELEILHGVLINPEMAGRAFFYFRDPKYIETLPDEIKADFLSEDPVSAKKQEALKNIITITCSKNDVPLYKDYPDPKSLAPIILNQLKNAIEKQFPLESIPDPLTREAHDHEAFAEIRCRTYIGRPDYFSDLDRHCNGNGKPLLLLGDSGSGKSALIANWVEHWRKEHPYDFIFQHYIGGTTDSAVHWKLMARLMAEIKRWTGDDNELPRSNDDLLRNMSLWLAKVRIKAERDGVKFVIVFDALNQLEDKDHAHLLGWLPSESFFGNLRLIVSTLPGDTLRVLENRFWIQLRVEPLTPDERGLIIVDYLNRFGKKLDKPRLDRLSNTKAAANPLYLKTLLDELRVTGTHDKLDERLDDYLSAPDISSLLQKVLARYKRDYEHDHKGLVGKALGFIWSSRRGLTEIELLQILRPDNLPQLPIAIWAPLRAVLEESLVDRGGVLNFAHDFLRSAIETEFVPDIENKNKFRLELADYFEVQPPSARSCDELPWLLRQSKSYSRLRNCLLNIDCFLEIQKRDEEELRSYWIDIGEESNMGQLYLDSFNLWKEKAEAKTHRISYIANQIGFFLHTSALHTFAEPLYRLSLKIDEETFGTNNRNVARDLNNLAAVLHETDRMSEAKPLMEKAITIFESIFGYSHPHIAYSLNNLATMLKETNHLSEAEPLIKRALQIDEENFGKDHPNVARDLNNLAGLLKETNRLNEAEPLIKRALQINEGNFGEDHPNVAFDLNHLATLFKETNRWREAEPLMKRALLINEKSFGKNHPNVAMGLSNLAMLLKDTNRLSEAEPLMKRALSINEKSFGENHPNIATDLNNLAALFKDTNRLSEAESLINRALQIDEKSFGKDHPKVARDLNKLAALFKDTNRMSEAEPLMKRMLLIDENSFGESHPNVASDLNNLAQLLQATNRLSEAEPLMKRALLIDEESFGKDHPKVAIRLNNLAQLLQATNRLNEAEPLMKRALLIDEESYGKDHPNVAIRLNNLALLLLITSRTSEAEPLIRRALRIDEKSFGENHPNVATGLSNLARLLKDTNRLSEAEPLIKQALKIDEESFGKDHPNVARDLNELAMLFIATNRINEAEPLLIRALQIDEESFGKDHPNVAWDLNELAMLYKNTDRISEAEPLMERALKIDEESFGTNHPNVAIDLNSLAQLFQLTNRMNEAVTLIKRALQIDEKSYGIDHPNVAIRLNNLANLLLDTNKMSEAEPPSRRAVEILTNYYRRTGHLHSCFDLAVNNYSSVLHVIGWSKDQISAQLQKIAPEIFK